MRISVPVALAAVAVVADELLKKMALERLPDEGSLSHTGILTLAVHKNWGIAFDIPFKMELVILVSVVIGILLLLLAYRTHKTDPAAAAGSLLIVIGACGNLYDRVAYGFTVDYLIFFSRSAINLSDVVIVLGVLTLLGASRRTDSHKHTIDDTAVLQ
jgi:signal peptidase II